MAGEGSGEIEANTRRLATSKKAVGLASKNLKAAEAALKIARDAFDIANEAQFHGQSRNRSVLQSAFLDYYVSLN
jgi:hypothetical protein